VALVVVGGRGGREVHFWWQGMTLVAETRAAMSEANREKGWDGGRERSERRNNY